MLAKPRRTACARSMRAVARGITMLELLGCVAAVLGGMWLGTLYLGVNVQHVAHAALHQSQLLDKVPPQWRPEAVESTEPIKVQTLATLRTELGSLRGEAETHRADTQAPTLATSGAPSGSLQERTRSYWLALNAIACNEDALQRDAEAATDRASAATVFGLKGRVCRIAAQEVEAIPAEGVEAATRAFGHQLAAWYEAGGELYEKASQIDAMPSRTTARAAATETWKRAEIQHRNEARLLRDRAAVLRTTLSREFGEQFPEFARQAETGSATQPGDRRS